ncbi:uncharacterized protein LOC135476780 [Liolophura sinensis]|uniref:uncharacterized protein LOC135476780 n=1 Tax=Liolophura sinensis TaxID=3198878 RepID=UPI003158011E
MSGKADLPSLSPSPKANVEKLRDAIIDDAETPQLKYLIEKCNCVDVQVWRDQGSFDLMHYAILANNQEAVLLLLMKGLFQPNYETSVPYLHLACELGFRTITGLLLDRLGSDFPAVYKHGEFPIPVKSKTPSGVDSRRFFDSETKGNTEKEEVSAIDVAAMMGRLNCVRFLLDRYERDVINRAPSWKRVSLNQLGLATICKSATALKLLLELGKHSKDDILRTVAIAIRQNQPYCLDLLLSKNVDTSSLYSGMNLYHVVSQYPIPLYEGLKPCLAEMTSVLLKHGYDVTAKSPSRTYPLYSVLSSEAVFSDPNATSCEDIESILHCLRTMIAAGADPNFDEAATENPDEAEAYGREAYPSALFCLFHAAHRCAKTSDEPLALLREKTLRCFQLLLEYSADVRKVAAVYHLFGDGEHSNMTVLHEYIRCSTALGVDPKILCLLMKHGADPMAKFKGMLPLTMYCLGRHSLAKDKADSMRRASVEVSLSNLTTLLRLCDYLPVRLVQRYQANLRDVLPNDEFLYEYHSTMTNYLTSVRSLKHESSTTIWAACSYKAENVDTLPLPRDLKSFIVPNL